MEFQKADSFKLGKKVKRLYKRAFPVYERKPFKMIKKLKKEGKGETFAIMVQGKFAGLAIVIFNDRFVLLDYFAVDGRVRGKGLGSAALQQLISMYDKKTLILEIESTRAACDNWEERQKRKAFYFRNGMRAENFLVDWFGTEMELLSHGEDRLTFEEYHDIFVQVYGEKIASKVKKIS